MDNNLPTHNNAGAHARSPMDTQAASGSGSAAPVSSIRLSEIVNGACKSTFDTVSRYEHAHTSAWNTQIINTILQSLISETSPAGGQPSYKYAVTSTIIQHHPSPHVSEEKAVGDRGEISARGRGGMHTASGAYWNNEKDGMWSHKFDEEKKGFDVVISIIWVSIV